jgi:hypothetical protein
MLQNPLMGATQVTEAETALRRAQLHLRLGKRRLQKGYTTAGMTALYDAILCGLRFYIAKHKLCASFVENTNLWDGPGLFHGLARAGVFDDPLAMNRFSLIVERTLWQGSFSSNADVILAEVEKLLTKLGVMPFNESDPLHESLAAN